MYANFRIKEIEQIQTAMKEAEAPDWLRRITERNKTKEEDSVIKKKLQ